MESPYNAVAVALSLPELVSVILGCYFSGLEWRQPGDRPNSAAALRVNSLWFDCGIGHLWSDPNACAYLLEVSRKRRQIYASKMEYMSVWFPRDYGPWSVFDGLEFPRLKHFATTIPFNTPSDELEMEHFYVRTLQRFEFDGPLVSADLLRLLQDSCPNLKNVEFHTYKHPTATAPFAEFIRNMRHLETFIFKTAGFATNATRFIDGDLVLSLASRDSLTKLQVPWDWSTDAADSAARRLEDLGTNLDIKPFPALMKLTLCARQNVMRTLAPMLGNLSSLRLMINAPVAGALEPLRELVNLTSLEVTFRRSVNIPGHSLTGLAALSKLESLELRPLHPVWTRVTSSFSDADLELVAAHWPRLRSFGLFIKTAVSGAGFRALARHCRELRRWEMWGPLQVDELLAQGYGGVVLFPELEHLRLEGFAGVDYTMGSSWVGSLYFQRLLEYHFPRLRELITPHCQIQLSEHAFTESML
ncbi:hypothetical protein HDV57DRAFT_502983 [Trichoderma longibrachiatum]